MNFELNKKRFPFKRSASILLAATMAFGGVPVNVLAAEDVPNAAIEQQKGPQKGDITGNASETDRQEYFLPKDGSGAELSIASNVEIKEYDGEKWVLVDPADYEKKGVTITYRWVGYFLNDTTFTEDVIDYGTGATCVADRAGDYNGNIYLSINGSEPKLLWMDSYVVYETPEEGALRCRAGNMSGEVEAFLKDGHVMLKEFDNDLYVEEFDGTKYVKVPEADFEKKGVKVETIWYKGDVYESAGPDSVIETVSNERQYDATEANQYKYFKNISLENGNGNTYVGYYNVSDLQKITDLKANETKAVSIEKNREFQALKFVPSLTGEYRFSVKLTKSFGESNVNGESNHSIACFCDENYVPLAEGDVVTEAMDLIEEQTFAAKLQAGKTYYLAVSSLYPGEVQVTSESSVVEINTREAKLSRSEYVYTGAAMKPAVSIDGLKEGEDFTVSYKNNVNAGTAKAVITGKGVYTGTIEKSFTIKKAAQSIKVSTASKTVKAKKVKKKAQVTSKVAVSGAKAKVSYKKVSGSSRLTINKNTGKITVKKKTKRGTYKIKVKVTAPTTANYAGAVKTVTVKVKVK